METTTKNDVVESLSECITEISNLDAPDNPVVHRAIVAREVARQKADLLDDAMSALQACIEHMEWSTPQGRDAREVACRLVVQHDPQ